MEPRPRSPLTLAAALLSAAAGCRSSGDASEVVQLIRAERYEAAVTLASELAEDRPGDEEAAQLHRDATVALLIERGRNAVFDGRHEDALDEFNRALAISPQNETVSRWILKTRDELTKVWLDRGLEFLQAEDFDRAIQAYELAEYYTPRHPEALFGATRVLFLINYRQGMGEDYYNQGVRAVHEHYLMQARHKFSAAGKYTDDDPQVEERRARVESSLAEERLYVARAFEQGGDYGAAQVEYRIVLKLEEDNAEALAGLERMNAEVQAARLLDEADMLIRQRRFDEALERLALGRTITKLQADRFGKAEGDVETAQWGALYARGIDEESDFRFEEAIATYTELLEKAEFYEDAEKRRETLREYVARAEALYARVLAAQTDEEARGLLREFELFWPEYKDVQARIAALAE